MNSKRQTNMFSKKSRRQEESNETIQVRFNQTITIFHNDECFTPQEASLLWFQDSDYERIDDSNDKIVDAMTREENQGIKSTKRHYCARGLERLLSDHGLTIEETRQAMWDAVLDEQFFQRCTGVEDPEAIATICRELSTHPFERIAQLRGAMDEKEAYKIYFNSVRGKVNKERMNEVSKEPSISTSDLRIKKDTKIQLRDNYRNDTTSGINTHSSTQCSTDVSSDISTNISTTRLSLSPTSRRRSSLQMYQKKKMSAIFLETNNDCTDIPSVISIPLTPLSRTCRRRSSLKLYEKKRMEELSLSFSPTSIGFFIDG